ncbi:MAG: carboxypeptidase-like regulatory domain-containing protein [Terracidiphilus sp.]|jgi:hypothetical protein
MKFAKSMLGLVLAVLLCVSMARAQENAELSGTVTDPTGAVIPNAKVTITNVATGESRTVTSNGAGLFDFSGLNHGTYNMKVEAEGFNSFQRSNIVNETGPDRPGKCRPAGGCRNADRDG